MKTEALILMLAAYITVTSVTIYFFIKVLTTPHKPGEDEEPVPEVKSFDVT